MSVLIQKIDMPSMCCVCPCHDYDMETNRYYCQVLKDEPRIIDENTRRDDCPLTEVPTPHGRLIDADALKNQVAQWRDSCRFQDAQVLCTVIDMIHKAPTVIEAEVSE